MIAGVAIGCALLGFLAGLFSFKIKSTLCRECGAVKTCPQCWGKLPAMKPKPTSGIGLGHAWE